MPRLINIATKDNNAYLLNAGDISVVADMLPSKNIGTDVEELLVVYPQSKYAPIQINRKALGIAVGDCAQKLSAGGVELFPFPYVWGDKKEIGRLFVNPGAFTYLITSEAFIPEGKTEPHVAMLLGMEGHGRVESYEVPVSAVEQFMDIVKQRRPGLVRVNPSEATARFYQPGYVVYDPLKVIRIYQNGHQGNVRFTSPWDVDFSFRPEVIGRYLRSKYGADKIPSDEQGAINQGCIDKAYAFERKLRFRLQREFARKVAAKAAPDLVRIEGADTILYTRFKNVASVQVYASENPDQETMMYLSYHDGTPDSAGRSDDARAYFKTQTAAAKEVERLQALLPDM